MTAPATPPSRQVSLRVAWLRRRADELDKEAQSAQRQAAQMRENADRIEAEGLAANAYSRMADNRRLDHE